MSVHSANSVCFTISKGLIPMATKNNFSEELIDIESSYHLSLERKAEEYAKNVLHPFCDKTSMSFKSWHDDEEGYKFSFNAEEISLNPQVVEELKQITSILSIETFVSKFSGFFVDYTPPKED
jgi:hypothetical protein